MHVLVKSLSQNMKVKHWTKTLNMGQIKVHLLIMQTWNQRIFKKKKKKT